MSVNARCTRDVDDVVQSIIQAASIGFHSSDGQED
jgi:hypothetical protein